MVLITRIEAAKVSATFVLLYLFSTVISFGSELDRRQLIRDCCVYAHLLSYVQLYQRDSLQSSVT